MGEVEREDGVARLQDRKIHGGVGLTAGVRLDVGVIAAEELLDPLAGQLLNGVHVLAAAVVALTWIAFGVLVGEDRTEGLENGLRDVVFGGDHAKNARHGAGVAFPLCRTNYFFSSFGSHFFMQAVVLALAWQAFTGSALAGTSAANGERRGQQEGHAQGWR